MFNQRIKITLLLGVAFLIFPFFVSGAELGDKADFFVNSEYDILDREQASTTLMKITPSAYFYIGNYWWDGLSDEDRALADDALEVLAQEFETKIYPNLTNIYGSEAKPGIDNDTRVTILLHSMVDNIGGYFSTADGYSVLQANNSNEREMVYLSSRYLSSYLAKSFLAHEFTHLITFNQKDKIHNVSDDIWLNEARAEFAPYLLGYDDDYEFSNLKMRNEDFRDAPNDSLTEWGSKKDDYGVIRMFAQYLVEQYGTNILIDSLWSPKIGIDSLNYALEKNGFEKDFSEIFVDWTIAVYLNDCDVSEKYCYSNENLINFHITPQVNFLPTTGNSSLMVSQTTKDWAGNWYKFVGGSNALKLEFRGGVDTEFVVPYIVQKKNGDFSVDFLEFDSEQKATIYITDFNKENISLILIPSIQKDILPQNGGYHSFSWTASTVDKTPEQIKEEKIQGLLQQIAELQSAIATIQARINTILATKIENNGWSGNCGKIQNNLSIGMKSNEVYCLQKALSTQGADIYPEGLVTGYFGYMTQMAVIRFQEKYASTILHPLELKKGTGFVGASTRAKLNKL